MNGQHHKPRHPTSQSTYTTPIYDTTALTSALTNPYTQLYAPSYMSQHYYQAYIQACSNNGPPRTTPEGYTFSSAYVLPGMAIQTSQAASSLPAASDRAPSQIHSKTVIKPILNHLTYGTWYQPGNCRCTRAGCPFTGSRKSVEIHMLDRHFIFPPGWQKREEWDADPSLKGKPVAIQGTSLVLNTPEAIDAWIAERKRRFPTADRVEDKKRKLEEAAARGELTAEDIGVGARKKHKRDAAFTEGVTRGSRGQGYKRGRGRLRGMMQRRESCAEAVDDVTNPTTDSKTKRTCEASQKSDSSEGNDEAPEVASSKVPTAPAYLPPKDIGLDGQVQNLRPSFQERVKKKPQPKKPPRNPFATRSTLLRNLLLPEIRITVSNLSQAIHFLVDNDFLRDVELRPGETQERMIEVLESRESPCSTEPT